MDEVFEDGQLILAAEDCSDEDFKKYHKFSGYEERIILQLMAHGPVLLKGGRGSGKSALLIEANRRLSESPRNVFSVYLSMRHLPLLKSKGVDYHIHFCRILLQAINEKLKVTNGGLALDIDLSQDTLRHNLVDLSKKIGKRIVFLFDDAAHIGREADLSEFFDLFRTLSGNTVSCKAAIYPGVTKFGTRFDVYNDATVLDIARDERADYFPKFFLEVIAARYPTMLGKLSGSLAGNEDKFGRFLGRAVLGNMRTFIFACNKINEQSQIGLNELTASLIFLASEYYWPLLEELKPKLGIYEPMLKPAEEIGEVIFKNLGETQVTSCVIHRDIQQRLTKPLEILEYVGFVAKREASKSMKSGGRGVRYTVNLCNLLENISDKRITNYVFENWLKDGREPFEFHSSSSKLDIVVPEPDAAKNLAILDYPIEILKKSKIYPYGLTDAKVENLKNAEYKTVIDLASATDAELMRIEGIGPAFLKRIRNVIAQAIWM